MMNKGDFVPRKNPTPNTSDDDVILAASLPYDLLVMIVARVPISYYRTLSLVSNSFRSMLASPELHKVRSLLGLTETCLYVCLGFRFGSYKWYTLSSKRTGGGYVLGRVPTVPEDNDDSSLGFSDLVAVGSDIYTIMETDHIPQTSGVSVLDCNKSHTWREAPGMPVELDELSVRVLDGNIYVLGSRKHHRQDGYWENSFQVFDTNTQTWDPPYRVFDCTEITFTVDGKLHALTYVDGVFAFDPKHCRWDSAEQYSLTPDSMFAESYCEIDNVLYSVSAHGALRWYDTDETRWRDLTGLVGLPKLPTPHGCIKFTGCGGGGWMMVFWNDWSQRDTIFCAEIALERRNGDVWGKLEWYGSVLTGPEITRFVTVLSVTL